MIRIKSKKTSQIVKSRRLRIMRKKTINSRFWLGIILLLALICFGFMNSKISPKQTKFYKLTSNIPLKPAIAKIKIPSPTPTATPTPTPTPIPLSGYCLRVPVLMYHHIQPEAAAQSLGQTSLTVDNGMFDQQMAYLVTQGYTPVWASELVDALRNHTGLPEKPIVVTMDDGYADNDIYALPVLRKYAVKANLMLSTGLVDSNPDMLTWSQVNDMKGSGLIYITNHTWSHYALTRGPQDKVDSEIDTAQTQIQQNTGQTVNIFTYPYGAFDNNVIATLQGKGYLAAFSEIPGQYQCDSFIMTLHRTRIGNAPLSAYGI